MNSLIGMRGEGERRQRAFPRVDVELFLQLANKRLLPILAEMQLLPGNPQTPARALPFGLCARGFALPVADVQTIAVTYPA